jgi:hypothetical protein
MKYNYLELLKNTSNKSINLLKDVGRHVHFDKRGKFKYCYIPFFEIKGIRDFLISLEGDSLYTVIPVLSMYGKNEDPYMILSEQILMTHYSNPNLISYFIKEQLDTAINDFEGLPSSLRTLASKYKVSDQKGYFPYSFVSEDTLNYIGPTPSISQFNGISAEEYEGLISFT